MRNWIVAHWLVLSSGLTHCGLCADSVRSGWARTTAINCKTGRKTTTSINAWAAQQQQSAVCGLNEVKWIDELRCHSLPSLLKHTHSLGWDLMRMCFAVDAQTHTYTPAQRQGISAVTSESAVWSFPTQGFSISLLKFPFPPPPLLPPSPPLPQLSAAQHLLSITKLLPFPLVSSTCSLMPPPPGSPHLFTAGHCVVWVCLSLLCLCSGGNFPRGSVMQR